MYLIAFFRVCYGWNVVISRKGAPFLRRVITSTDSLCRGIFGRIKRGNHRFWSFANDATTLVVCGEADDGVSSKTDLKFPICALWDCYTSERCIHGRLPGINSINKVVYANVVVHPDVFRCPAVMQVGFKTMLYHSTLKFPVADISRHGATDVRFKKLLTTLN